MELVAVTYSLLSCSETVASVCSHTDTSSSRAATYTHTQADRQAHTGRHTDLQGDRQTDKHTQADIQTYREIDRQTSTHRQTHRPTGR